MHNKTDKQQEGMRLDKWLWCARFFKTRKLATEAIRNGRVRENGHRIKPARTILPGDSISIRKGPFTWIITLLALTHTRLSASDAEKLYHEHQDSIEARNDLALQLKADRSRTPRPRKRPDKRARRELIRFTRHRE